MLKQNVYGKEVLVFLYDTIEITWYYEVKLVLPRGRTLYLYWEHHTTKTSSDWAKCRSAATFTHLYILWMDDSLILLPPSCSLGDIYLDFTIAENLSENFSEEAVVADKNNLYHSEALCNTKLKCVHASTMLTEDGDSIKTWDIVSAPSGKEPYIYRYLIYLI